MVDLMHENISSVLLTRVEFDKDDCLRLLNVMEEAGMSPPYGKHQSSYDVAMGSLPMWEPENEEK